MYFGLQFYWFQSAVAWFLCFGSELRLEHQGGSMWGAELLTLIAVGKQQTVRNPSLAGFLLPLFLYPGP
jgi:hypothetical protein